MHLTPPLGVFPLESREKIWSPEIRIMGLAGSEDKFDDRLIRFDTIPACDGQTEGQTDVQPISIACAVILMHVKNL